jgi:hypothetical protein
VYLKSYGEATTAYNDLRPFAERLEFEDRIQVVRILTGNSLFGDLESLRAGNLQFSGKLCPAQEDVRVFLALLLLRVFARILSKWAANEHSSPPPTQLLQSSTDIS